MPAVSVVVLKSLLALGVAAAGLACLLLPVIAVSVLLLHKQQRDDQRKKP